MNLNKNNLKKFLKARGACGSGMSALTKALNKNKVQKKSMKAVYERLQKREAKTFDYNISWACEEVARASDNYSLSYSADTMTFETFKQCFEELDKEIYE